MEFDLVPHPVNPARSVDRVRVRFAPLSRGGTMIDYRVFARDGLALPAPGPAERRDGLWQTTCFELFVKPVPGEAYFEFNFSPSHAWAAYGFKTQRRGMRELELATPKIDFWSDITGCALRVTVDLVAPWAGDSRVGLSAIIEEADGTKSYWALAHPPGEPDFHHPDCFALELPPLV